nr:hypothetical protein [Armatimonadota bacterium]
DTGRWAFEYPVVEGGINGILKPLSVPLNALPVGENVYSDYLSYGGALKFWAKVDGLPQGIWGYTLPAMSKRVVELPLHAADGHSITSLTVQLGLAVTDPARVNLRVSLIGTDGNSSTLASDAAAASNLLTAPAAALGAATTLRVEMENLTTTDYVSLTNLGLHIKVE